MSDSSGAWRCSVCGYIHRGAEPPDVCPVCGAPRDLFEPFAEQSASAVAGAGPQWRCLICNYVHGGSQPPAACPVCGAPADRFAAFGAAAAAGAVHARKLRVVVIGAGIAGVSAVESLRSASTMAQITLVSLESELPYYRLNLTRYLAGELGEQDLPLHPAAWYDQRRIELLLGAEAAEIRLDQHVVELRDGRRLPFDKLLLAAGAHPFVPPLPGADRTGVTSLRTLADARAILAACAAGARCVCIGGGLLGLETAGALARRGVDVTLLEGHAWLLPRQLNQRAGEILNDFVAHAGIKLRTKVRIREIAGRTRAEGVLLEDGLTLPAELVVIATGIRPNSHLARRAGLEINQGVVVDPLLTASHPDVFAAGDAAEHQGQVYGIWGPSQYQGHIAGLNMAGGRSEFGGVPHCNTLKVLGLDLFSIGQFNPPDGSFLALDHESGGHYFRFVFHDNYLAGAVLLGDTQLTARVHKAVESKTDFSALLAGRPTARAVIERLAEGEQATAISPSPACRSGTSGRGPG
ncbi:MAG: FAD-dependent oxidoreductase [Thermoguttaceae bacterium]|jgi:nitrite reductase (NADH) large subunit